jgi:hypothetical protein
VLQALDGQKDTCYSFTPVTLLPSSPRVRRRLAKVGVAAVLTAGCVGAYAVVTGDGATKAKSYPAAPPASAQAEPADVPAAPQQEVRLSRRDKRAIDRTLDRFITLAVARRNPIAAFDVVGPTLRSGTTRADWLKGDVPVYPFPARDLHFHDWKPNLSYRNDVLFDLLVHPKKGSKQGPISFTIEMKRIKGHWVVDGFVPVAIFSPTDSKPTVTSQADYAPGVYSVQNSKSQIAHVFVLIPLALLALALVVPLALGCVSWYRGRRAVAEVERLLARREALPPSGAR